jgi:DNA mismatch repair protein MutL
VQRDLVLQELATAGAIADLDCPASSPATPLVEIAPEVLASHPAFRFIGTLHGRFAILESADGLVLMDPRAARERILYERWLALADGSGVESQLLLVPLLLEPGPREAELALRQREAFSRAGIEVGDFGSGTLRIGSMPAFLSLGDPRPFLMGLIDDLAEGISPGAKPAFEHFAKIIARRAAIAESPKPAEAAGLLPILFACDLPYCAPDGRPTLTEFSLRELERRFSGTRARD